MRFLLRFPVLLRTASLAPLALGCGAGEIPAPELTPNVSLTQPLMYGDHDYLFIRTTRTWAQAGALCDSLGYGLVTVNDAQEEAFLRRFDRGNSWWLGANDIQTEGRWVWRDGTSSYSNWYPGQPDDSNGEDCGAGNWTANHQWNDLPCNAGLYVICESRD
jgi:hypothetical protein